jgi:NADP-dependent 3-hydroxy acid dehydrogenase YdfG
VTLAPAEYVRSVTLPLTTDDMVDCVLVAVTRPPHVNLDEVVIKARAQLSGCRIVRDGSAV